MLSSLRKEGLKVVEYRTWRTHNRNSKGSWGDVKGVIIHHTAGADSAAGLNLVYNGRSDLPGPLAHAYLDKKGVVTLTGNGRANHAGLGDNDVLQAVIEENYGSTPPKPNQNNVDGNGVYYGIEVANLGNGKDYYPTAQYDAAVKWAAAICRAHGWSEKSVIGHKEWTNQKIDPKGPVGSSAGAQWSMVNFRNDVKAQLAGTYKKPATPTKPVENVPQASAQTIPGGPYFFEAWRASGDSLLPDQWYNVTFTNENSDFGEIITPGTLGWGAAGFYHGVVYFELSGVPEGDEIQVRLAEKNTSNQDMKYTPIVEGIGTGGNTFFAYPFVGQLPANRKLNVQILNTTPGNVTLELMKIYGHWHRV